MNISGLGMKFPKPGEARVSHNKSKQMQEAVRLIERVIDIERRDGSALPGSAVRKLKEAKKLLLRDIRKRREGRKRERIRNGT